MADLLDLDEVELLATVLLRRGEAVRLDAVEHLDEKAVACPSERHQARPLLASSPATVLPLPRDRLDVAAADRGSVKLSQDPLQ